MLMALDGGVENPQMWTVQFRSEESQHYKFDELFATMHSFWDASPIKTLQPDGLVLLVHMAKE